MIPKTTGRDFGPARSAHLKLAATDPGSIPADLKLASLRRATSANVDLDLH